MHAVCIWYNASRSVRWQISGGTKGGYLACGGGIKSIDSQTMRCLVNCSKPEASVANWLQLVPSATASQATFNNTSLLGWYTTSTTVHSFSQLSTEYALCRQRHAKNGSASAAMCLARL